jgi:4-hydroxyacetophenone monooxygenase
MDGNLAAKPSPPRLEVALAEAHIPTLVMSLVQLTGDLSWLEGERPVYMPFGDGQGDLSPAFQAKVRAAAAEAMQAYNAGRPLPPCAR